MLEQIPQFGDINNTFTGSVFRSVEPVNNLSKRTNITYILPPASGEAFPMGIVTCNITPVKVWAYADANFLLANIEQRAIGSPFSTGTQIITSNIVVGTAGTSATSFTGGITASTDAPVWLWYKCVSFLIGTPTKVILGFEYTVD